MIREYTKKIVEDIENGIISKDAVINAFLVSISESIIKEIYLEELI